MNGPDQPVYMWPAYFNHFLNKACGYASELICVITHTGDPMCTDREWQSFARWFDRLSHASKPGFDDCLSFVFDVRVARANAAAHTGIPFDRETRVQGADLPQEDCGKPFARTDVNHVSENTRGWLERQVHLVVDQGGMCSSHASSVHRHGVREGGHSTHLEPTATRLHVNGSPPTTAAYVTSMINQSECVSNGRPFESKPGFLQDGAAYFLLPSAVEVVPAFHAGGEPPTPSNRRLQCK